MPKLKYYVVNDYWNNKFYDVIAESVFRAEAIAEKFTGSTCCEAFDPNDPNLELRRSG